MARRMRTAVAGGEDPPREDRLRVGERQLRGAAEALRLNSRPCVLDAPHLVMCSVLERVEQADG